MMFLLEARLLAQSCPNGKGVPISRESTGSVEKQDFSFVQCRETGSEMFRIVRDSVQIWMWRYDGV